MTEQSRPRLVVVEGDKKSESALLTKASTAISMDSLLSFARDIARIENKSIENNGNEKSHVLCDTDRLMKVKTADIVSLGIPHSSVRNSPEEQLRGKTQSAEKK